jgi:2-amino-4-hydroxy-6-hydroxymethyldihydropteridine diphosphokinase
VSPVYETEAHTIDADTTQPPFLNAVMEVRTLRGPEALLSIGKALEHDAGRSPTDRRWAPRPLDIDILTYNHCTRSSATLTLPHPRLAERRFVLRPWADIAPNLQIPAPFDASVRALLARCPDASSIRRVGPAR